MKILYFAWLRTTIGCAEETVTPPLEINTAGALVAWLKDIDAKHGDALSRPELVRIAVNQEFADPETPVSMNDEIGLFPPVTGG
ncbi:MAG: molybdopterin converting factor subunit 1 [Rhodospirillales bacterium]|nr:molybdopterin converting factor subunit 1 [Rhodospirillales bacterium]